MKDITERLRNHDFGPDEWLSDLLKEAASLIEHYRSAMAAKDKEQSEMISENEKFAEEIHRLENLLRVKSEANETWFSECCRLIKENVELERKLSIKKIITVVHAHSDIENYLLEADQRIVEEFAYWLEHKKLKFVNVEIKND